MIDQLKIRKHTDKENDMVKNPGFPFDLLNDDLLIDILTRLPVKNLCRFMCVQKSWLNLISSPSFINLHRQQSMKNPKLIWLDGSDFDRELTLFPTVIFSLMNSKQSCQCSDHLFTLTLEKNYSISYVCPISCDIVCFITTNSQIYLCNPSKRQFRILPTPSIGLVLQMFKFGLEKLGFGYAASTREYKVVHLKSSREFAGMSCETFTFGDHAEISSSSWTISKENCPYLVSHNSMSTDGKIYWLIQHLPSFSKDEFIVSFDIATESFKTISRPSTWTKKNYVADIVFMELGGNLCITDQEIIRHSSCLEIWMLKDDCFWEQEYSINLDNYCNEWKTYSPLHIPSVVPKCIIDGDILLTIWKSWRLYWYSYNIEKKSYTETHLDSPYQMGIYRESLFELEK